ncbi:MAG: hypothetical protein U0N66_06660 [Blautia sp.]
MDSKKEIRKYIFGRRKETSVEEVEENSRVICEKILALPEFQHADCV